MRLERGWGCKIGGGGEGGGVLDWSSRLKFSNIYFSEEIYAKCTRQFELNTTLYV